MNVEKYNVYNIFFEIIFFFSSFCYIKFFNIGTNTDLQIYYFVVSLIFLLLTIEKINKEILIITIILFLVLIYNFFIDYNDMFSYFRGAYGYISFLVIFYTTYKFCNIIDLKKIEKRVKIYFVMWNIVGLIQCFDKSLLIFWRNRAVIGDGRGSISFATEPAYFVFFLILSSSILYSINLKNKYYFLISLFFSIILAKSFIGMSYLLIITTIVFLNKKNILKIISLVIGFSLIIYSFGYNIPQNIDYRILKLLREIIRNPFLLVIKDGSIRNRIIHIIFSIKGSLENLMLPNGFSHWGDYVSSSLIKYKNYFLLSQNEVVGVINEMSNNNINTMFGGMIYELGAIGLIFYYLIYKICLNKKIWFIILILSLDGLNITNPYLGILLGINYFLYKNKIEV